MKKAIQEVESLTQKVKLVALNNLLNQVKSMDEKHENELYEIK